MIDSHVHLAYDPVGEQLVAHGVTGVVDLAEPERVLVAPPAIPGLRVIAAGPMLTSPGGYPLDSWGADGYGIGCADEACVASTVDRLIAEGAGVIKIAGDPGGLDRALEPAVVAAAHRHGVKVAVHALTDEAARAAGAAGVDILAHTPVEPLAPETVALWRGRAVITTLAAFGGRPSTIANLRALRAVGVTVLYGTDLGNLPVTGVSDDEVALMRDAGMSADEISAAMTTVPSEFWGFAATR